MCNRVYVFAGHINKNWSPYLESINGWEKLFKEIGSNWQVKRIYGESLLAKLKKREPSETLLIMPAARSSELDEHFTNEQVEGLRTFFQEGGKGIFSCGSAYWVSQTRIYSEWKKASPLPLFQGEAIGPLLPLDSPVYGIDYRVDAIPIRMGEQSCTAYVGGGGRFELTSDQKVQILATYEQIQSVAALLVEVGKGAAMLTMFHPYHGKESIDPDEVNRLFPHSGTNWHEVVRKMSPRQERLKLFEEKCLFPLFNLNTFQGGGTTLPATSSQPLGWD